MRGSRLKSSTRHEDPETPSRERGLVTKALGYAIRQELALRRFLDDGRLRMDNNSENALRIVATSGKAWPFFGSDDHAEAAANLYSLIASCKLHGIDPERYLAEVIRIMPYWPRDRHLELAPAHWTQTQARLDPTELEAELGFVTVPPALARAPERRHRAEFTRSVTFRLSRHHAQPSRTGSTLRIRTYRGPDGTLHISCRSGIGDVVCDINSKRVRAECKGGPLVQRRGSPEYPRPREALGQLLTVETQRKL